MGDDVTDDHISPAQTAMTRPTCGHPSELWPNPPPHYVSCTTPVHWGPKFDIPAHNKRANRFFWLLYMTQAQGAYPTKALALAHLPAHADADLYIEFFDTHQAMLWAWRKFCFHRHGHCPQHLACHTACLHHPPATSNAVQNATTAAAHATNTARAVSDALAHAQENARAANQTLHALRIQADPSPHAGHDARRAGFAARLPTGRGRGGGMAGSNSSPRAKVAASSAAAAAAPGAAGASPARRYLATRAIAFHPPLARIPSSPPPYTLPSPPSSSSSTSPSPFPPPLNPERPDINDNDTRHGEDEDDGLIGRMSTGAPSRRRAAERERKRHEREAAERAVKIERDADVVKLEPGAKRELSAPASPPRRVRARPHTPKSPHPPESGVPLYDPNSSEEEVRGVQMPPYAARITCYVVDPFQGLNALSLGCPFGVERVIPGPHGYNRCLPFAGKHHPGFAWLASAFVWACRGRIMQ
ncbi:hypothetical protein C8F04DRAFT_1175400 [Mycena alexandri]|uniref:Uncharacterized protein n=1 Tax=Mycena alexandri TaxID=1745969 RepID=A0AAD6TG40_9AGAR|nr:hypothetical protein C8F04DRAFT_1175400 [Mycena alexandri]